LGLCGHVSPRLLCRRLEAMVLFRLARQLPKTLKLRIQNIDNFFHMIVNPGEKLRRFHLNNIFSQVLLVLPTIQCKSNTKHLSFWIVQIYLVLALYNFEIFLDTFPHHTRTFTIISIIALGIILIFRGKNLFFYGRYNQFMSSGLKPTPDRCASTLVIKLIKLLKSLIGVPQNIVRLNVYP